MYGLSNELYYLTPHDAPKHNFTSPKNDLMYYNIGG